MSPTVLMSQHIGIPAKPIVKKGDTIEAGQKIATVGDKLGCDIYSPKRGKVIELTDNYTVIR